jgi:hypothetical protein
VAVSQEVTTGMPAALLVSLSAEAQLAVVGHRGLGGFAGLVIGSVGTALAAHAVCPVVVVRGTDAPRQDGPIVVGLDGSPQSEAALAFAVEAAVARRGPPARGARLAGSRGALRGDRTGGLGRGGGRSRPNAAGRDPGMAAIARLMPVTARQWFGGHGVAPDRPATARNLVLGEAAGRTD